MIGVGAADVAAAACAQNGRALDKVERGLAGTEGKACGRSDAFVWFATEDDRNRAVAELSGRGGDDPAGCGRRAKAACARALPLAVAARPSSTEITPEAIKTPRAPIMTWSGWIRSHRRHPNATITTATVNQPSQGAGDEEEEEEVDMSREREGASAPPRA